MGFFRCFGLLESISPKRRGEAFLRWDIRAKKAYEGLGMDVEALFGKSCGLWDFFGQVFVYSVAFLKGILEIGRRAMSYL